jgi:hypothetical protein
MGQQIAAERLPHLSYLGPIALEVPETLGLSRYAFRVPRNDLAAERRSFDYIQRAQSGGEPMDAGKIQATRKSCDLGWREAQVSQVGLEKADFSPACVEFGMAFPIKNLDQAGFPGGKKPEEAFQHRPIPRWLERLAEKVERMLQSIVLGTSPYPELVEQRHEDGTQSLGIENGRQHRKPNRTICPDTGFRSCRPMQRVRDSFRATRECYDLREAVGSRRGRLGHQER